MYEKNISINILAPTLVLALIEEADLILIFSFSKLNRNARFYLGQYARATGKDVRVYDDERLERLILTTPAARAEFSHIPDEKLPELDRFVVSARLSKDPDVEYASDRMVLSGDGREIHLGVRSLFAVDVLVTNAGVNTGPVTGHLRVAADTFDSYRLLNRDIAPADPRVRFEVECGASAFIRLLFRAQREGPRAAPRLIVERDDATAAELSLDRVNVSSVLAVPLIGADAHAARRRFQTTAGARDKPIFYYLHGRSGTGKSRLLRELRDELLARNFGVFSFNGVDEGLTSFDVFLRHLIARLAKLPLLEGIDPPSESVIATAAAKHGTGLLELLYDRSFSPAKNILKCAGVVQSLLASRKAAVLIDNLQYFDDHTILFANEILTASLSGPAGTAVWAFAINEDMTTPDMPAAALAGRLAQLAAEAPDDMVDVPVRGFSGDDRLHYLDEALTLREDGDAEGPSFTRSYPRTARMILDAVESHRPLFLEQALHYAADRGALRLTDGVMYVADIEAFNEALRTLPPTIGTILKKRWDRIGRTLPAGSVRVIEALVVLSAIPLMMSIPLGFTPEDVRLLQSRGLVRISETNEARFHHEQHEQFFAGLFPPPAESRARDLYERIARSPCADSYALETATLRYAAGDFDDHHANALARLLVASDLGKPSQQRSTRTFLEILNVPWSTLAPSLELDAVSSVCQSVKRHHEFAVAAEVFTRSRAVRNARLERYLPAGESWFEFVRHHVNAYFAVHRDGEALPILEEAISSMARFRFESSTAARLAEGKILNRLGVAWKTVHDLDAAVDAIVRSLAIARSLGESALTYKNYVDWGYVYHGLGAENAQLIGRWEDALRIFDESEEMGRPLESERPSAMLHHAAILLLRRDDNAIEVIERGIRLCQRRLTPFHEVKLLLLRVVAELAWNRHAPSPGLMSWIDLAQDRAVTAAAYRSYWTVFYTRARLEGMLGRHAQAIEAFGIALQQLAKVLNDPRMEERYAPFYEDLVITFRSLRQPIAVDILALIRNARIRHTVSSISQMSDAAFDDFLSGYQPTATYHDGRFNLPVP
jgi:tetratricopeptide (TPR) repeat protein